MRLIDADALKEKSCNIVWGLKPVRDGDNIYGYETTAVDVEDIDNAPTIDPVKPGQWIQHDLRTSGHVQWDYQCSQCMTVHDYNTNFCPHCGARMDGGKHD